MIDWVDDADNEATRLETSGHDVEALRVLERCFTRMMQHDVVKSSPQFAPFAERLAVKYNTMGVRCFKGSDYDTGKANLDKALLIAKHTEGIDVQLFRRLTATTHNNLGCMERSRGNLETALHHLQHSNEIEENQSGATALNMSAILTQLERHDEAVVCARRAIAQLQENSAGNENLVIVAHHNLAIALESVSSSPQVDEEISLNYKTAVELSERRLGPTHPTTSTIVKNYNRWKQNRSKPRQTTNLPNLQVSQGGTAPRRQVPSQLPKAEPTTARQPIQGNVPGSYTGDRAAARRESDLRKYSREPAAPAEGSSQGPRRSSLTKEALDSLNSQQAPLSSTGGIGQGNRTQHSSTQPIPSPPPAPVAHNVTQPTPSHKTYQQQQQAQYNTQQQYNTPPAPPPQAVVEKVSPPPVSQPTQPMYTKQVDTPKGPVPVQTPRDAPQKSTGKTSIEPHPPEDNKKQVGGPRRRPSLENVLERKNSIPRGGVSQNLPDNTLSSMGNQKRTEVTEEDEKNKELAVTYMFNRLQALLRVEDDWEAKYIRAMKIQRLFRRYRAKKVVSQMLANRAAALRKQIYREEQAAKVVIRACRKMVRIRKRERQAEEARQKEQQKKDKAALRIQTAARRWLAKLYVQKIRAYYSNFNLALLKLQCWFRRMSALFRVRGLKKKRDAYRSQVIKSNVRSRAALDIQRVWRARVAKRRTDMARGKLKKARELNWQRLRMYSATKIQAVWHGLLSRRWTRSLRKNREDKLCKQERAQLLYQSATKIQSLWRRIRAERDRAKRAVKQVYSQQNMRNARRNDCAIKIQCLMRCFLARKQRRDRTKKRTGSKVDDKKHYAASRIQARWKGIFIRTANQRSKKQALDSIAEMRKKEREAYDLVIRQACAPIPLDTQKDQKNGGRAKDAAILLSQTMLRSILSQRRVRRIVGEMEFRVEKLMKKIQAASVLQRIGHGFAARRRFNKFKFLMLYRKVRKLQTIGYAFLTRRYLGKIRQSVHLNSAEVLQSFGRGYLSRAQCGWTNVLRRLQLAANLYHEAQSNRDPDPKTHAPASKPEAATRSKPPGIKTTEDAQPQQKPLPISTGVEPPPTATRSKPPGIKTTEDKHKPLPISTGADPLPTDAPSTPPESPRNADRVRRMTHTLETVPEAKPEVVIPPHNKPLPIVTDESQEKPVTPPESPRNRIRKGLMGSPKPVEPERVEAEPVIEEVPESPRHRFRQQSSLAAIKKTENSKLEAQEKLNRSIEELSTLEHAERNLISSSEFAVFRDMMAKLLELEKSHAEAMRLREEEKEIEIELERTRAAVSIVTSTFRGYAVRHELGVRHRRVRYLALHKQKCATKIQTHVRRMLAHIIVTARIVARRAHIRMEVEHAAAKKLRSFYEIIRARNIVKSMKKRVESLHQARAAKELAKQKEDQKRMEEEARALEEAQRKKLETGVVSLREEIQKLESQVSESPTRVKNIVQEMSDISGCSFEMLNAIEVDNTLHRARSHRSVVTLQAFVFAKLSARRMQEKIDLLAGRLSIQSAIQNDAAAKIQGMHRMAEARERLQAKMFSKSLTQNHTTTSSVDALDHFAANKIIGFFRMVKAKRCVLRKKETLLTVLENNDLELGAQTIQRGFRQFQKNQTETAKAKDELNALRQKREDERRTKAELEN
eukprot:PhF_6_TR25487/c0_g1_i1/m.35436